jgi:hypothetical protein
MTHRRPSSTWLVTTALLTAGFLATFADAAFQRSIATGAIAERRALVERLGLTDLCLFTEARYTRHPSQADLHSAFQDHPLALEHFPSGSLISPPRILLEHHEKLDRASTLPD